MTETGKLITFCGLDGSGKTTMINMLKNYLDGLGYAVKLTKQPTNAVRQSEIFRNYMDTDNHDAYNYRSLSLLAASDRVQHSNCVIKPLLEQGKIVLSDRYFYSCIANLCARGYTQDKWVYEIQQFVPKPDMAFFLDVDVDTAVRRVRLRPDERERYIDTELQYRLRKEYLKLASSCGGVVIQSFGGIRAAFEEIRRHTDILLHKEVVCRA